MEFFTTSNILQIVVTVAIAIIGGFLRNLMRDLNGLGNKLGRLNDKIGESNIKLARIEEAISFLKKDK